MQHADQSDSAHRLRTALHPAVLLAALSGAATMTGRPLLGAGLSCLAVAAAGRRTALEVVERLPASATAVIAWCVVATHLAGEGQWRLFDSASASRGTLLVPALAALLWTVRSPAVMTRDGGRVAALVATPAILWMTAGLVGSRLNGGAGMGWFGVGIDNVQHALITRFWQLEGALTYDKLHSPGGGQATLALVLAADPSSTGASSAGVGLPAGLAALVHTCAIATWSLYGLIILATSLLTRRIASWAAPTSPHLRTALAGAVGGFALTLPPFADVLAYGFFTLLLCTQATTAAVLSVSGRVRRCGDAVAHLLLVGCAGLLTLHSWPLAAFILLPPAFVAVRNVLAVRGDLSPRHVLVLVAAGGVLLWSGAAVAWMTLGAVDPVGRTAKGAIVPPIHVIPTLWFALAVPAVVTQLRNRRPTLATLCMVVAAIGAVALAIGVGVSLSSYYPSKLLWIAGLFAVPTAVAWLATVAGPGARAAVASPWARYVAAAASIVVITGGVVATGFWALRPSPTWRAMYAGTTGPMAPIATIVWGLPDELARVGNAMRLLDYYRLDAERLRQFPRTRTDDLDCAALRAAAHPRVLTLRSQAEVTAHFTCAPGTVALTVHP